MADTLLTNSDEVFSHEDLCGAVRRVGWLALKPENETDIDPFGFLNYFKNYEE